jgi:HEAT repeat protein
MKKALLFTALLLAGSLGLQNVSIGHGGTYRGPGDTVPPGGGGGGGGGAGPSGPAPAGPSTGGPSGPSAPAPGGPGATTGGPAIGGARPTTGSPNSGPDLTLWEFWWGFNKDGYLNLKSAIRQGIVTGDDDFFLGTGGSKQSKNTLKPSEVSIREKIVPALKEALEKERSNDIVTGAMIALAKIGDAKNEDGASEFEQILSKFLNDSNQEIAETSAVALGILANDASVKTLEALLRDNAAGRKLVGGTEVNYRSRAFAAYGLGLIGWNPTTSNEVRRQIVDILVDILDKPDSSTRDLKVASIVAFGLVPLEVDKGDLSEGKAGASASRQSQIKFLKKFFEDGERNHYLVRAHAPTALARLIKDTPAEKDAVAKILLDALGKNAKEKDEVKQSCVLALGQIGDTDKDKLDVEIRDTLKRVSEESSEPQARYFATISLGQIGGRAGKGEGNEDGVRDVRNMLLASLTKGKSGTRPWAGVAIGVMERAILNSSAAGQSPSSIAKDTLRIALKESTSPDQVGAYAIGCGIAKDIEAKDLLLAKLKEISDQQARGYVAVSLGLMDARDAVKPIQDIVKDSKYKPDLLKQAAIALGLLGDKELVLDLVGMLKEAKGLATQAAIASALGFIGDSRSIDPLVEMLRNKDLTATARGFAAVALGIVADKEELPWNSKISTNINYRANTSTLTDPQGTGILDIL